jgi:hypothetical protein
VKTFFIYLIASLPIMAQSAELPESSKTEISHLIHYLKDSGCQFNRNGSWYNATEASAHIQKKFNYLEDKHVLSSTESFIEKAASESSMTGKAYQVKCPNASPVNSAIWFTVELKKFRTEK